MKKILSLLSLLMVTVMAFAQSYQDALQFKVNLMGNKSVDLPNGTLSIEKRVDGTYNVVAQGCDFSSYEMGNWNDIVCEEVEGTTDENGLTTINVENPYVYATSGDYAKNFTGTSLEVKFNGTKAYAHFVGSVKIMFVARSFEYTFGTDEGWSTGGGETGGGETPSTNVKVVEDGYAPNASAFSFPFSIDWETQKLVAKIDLTNCEDTYYSANNTWNPDNIFTVGTSNATLSEWDPSQGALLHLFYSKRDGGKLKTHYLERNGSTVNRKDATIVTLSGTVTFVVDKEGLKYGDDETLLLAASNMPVLYTSADMLFGSEQGNGRSHATYELVEVQPLATEPVTPPTFEEKTLTKVANAETTYNGKAKNYSDVEAQVTEYEEGKYKVVYKKLTVNTTANDLLIGDVTVDNLTATVEGETTTLATTDATKATLTNLGEDFAGMELVTEGGELSLSDFAASYTLENEQIDKLNMKFYVAPVSMPSLVFGVEYGKEQAPEPPVEETEGTVVEGSQNYAANGEKFEWSNVAIDWNKQKIVAVVDLSTCGDDTKNENILSVGEDISAWTGANSYHFYYTKSDKGDGALRMKVNYLNSKNVINDGKTDIEAGTVRIEISKKNGVTVDGVEFNTLHSDITSGTWQENTADFWALTSVNIGSKQGDNRSNATIKYVSVVDLPAEPEVTEVSNKTYKSNMRIFDNEDENEANLFQSDNAQVNIVKYSDDSYKVTLKNVALGEQQPADLVFVGNEDAGVATSDEETEETEQVVSVIAQADEATEQLIGEGTMARFQWIEKSEEEIQMEFTLVNPNEETGYTYAGEFNYETDTPEPPVTEPFSKENFVGDGTNFNWSIPIDWDTQKVVMELDFSTCETGIEHIFGLGVDGTSWNKNLHMYRSSSDQQLQCYWDGADGNGNNNTDKFDETTPTYVEVSKEKGFVVNDETKIAAGRMDALYEMTTLTMGTGEGQNVLSHATYKYVKVVDKDWTREPETGINAVEAQFGADAQFYTVDGVKLSKLQKGLNIVRSADGKVKKVLVK